MRGSARNVRLSVTLPTAVARPNRVIVDLIESGLDAKEREIVAFSELAEQLAQTSGHAEQKRLKEALARMTFGEE
jgi:hypothetical protein